MPKYPPEPITIEFDGRSGKRSTKTFADHYEARRFYASKFKAGKKPRVKSAKRSTG